MVLTGFVGVGISISSVLTEWTVSVVSTVSNVLEGIEACKTMFFFEWRLGDLRLFISKGLTSESLSHDTGVRAFCSDKDD